MLKWLLKSLLIAAVFVSFATVMPLASLWLCRTPEGAQVVLWAAPWSACFWALFFSVFIGSRFWLGRDQVLAWRAARGGYVRSCLKSTGLMFLALFASYACEGAYIYFLPPTPIAMQFLPAATYAPAVFALWRAARG